MLVRAVTVTNGQAFWVLFFLHRLQSTNVTEQPNNNIISPSMLKKKKTNLFVVFGIIKNATTFYRAYHEDISWLKTRNCFQWLLNTLQHQWEQMSSFYFFFFKHNHSERIAISSGFAFHSWFSTRTNSLKKKKRTNESTIVKLHWLVVHVATSNQSGCTLIFYYMPFRW